MRVVIPYKFTKNNDLFWAILSIQKNYAPLSEIIVVGDKPAWDGEYTFISCKDQKDKEYSIFNKLKQVPGEVLFTNDDIFLLNPISEIPNYYKGTCGEKANKGAPYYRRMYKRCNPQWLDFDVHCPMIINTDTFEWQHCRPLKSQYGNTHDLKGTFTKDFKVNTLEEIDLTRPFLSINDPLSRFVEPILKKILT